MLQTSTWNAEQIGELDQRPLLAQPKKLGLGDKGSLMSPLSNIRVSLLKCFALTSVKAAFTVAPNVAESMLLLSVQLGTSAMMLLSLHIPFLYCCSIYVTLHFSLWVFLHTCMISDYLC